MQLKRYFQQHHHTLKMIDDIEQKLANPKTTSHELSQSLINYAGPIKHQLKMGDNFLYPKLLEAADDENKNLVHKLSEEMKPVSNFFFEFVDFWGPNQIEADRQEFVTVAQEVVDSLRNRISTEMDEVHPLTQNAS